MTCSGVISPAQPAGRHQNAVVSQPGGDVTINATINRGVSSVHAISRGASSLLDTCIGSCDIYLMTMPTITACTAPSGSVPESSLRRRLSAPTPVANACTSHCDMQLGCWRASAQPVDHQHLRPSKVAQNGHITEPVTRPMGMRLACLCI